LAKALAPYKDTKKGMKRSQEEIRNLLVETRTELKNNLNNLYGFGDALMRVGHLVYLIWEEPWYSKFESLRSTFVVTAYPFEHLDQVLPSG